MANSTADFFRSRRTAVQKARAGSIGVISKKGVFTPTGGGPSFKPTATRPARAAAPRKTTAVVTKTAPVAAPPPAQKIEFQEVQIRSAVPGAGIRPTDLPATAEEIATIGEPAFPAPKTEAQQFEVREERARQAVLTSIPGFRAVEGAGRGIQEFFEGPALAVQALPDISPGRVATRIVASSVRSVGSFAASPFTVPTTGVSAATQAAKSLKRFATFPELSLKQAGEATRRATTLVPKGSTILAPQAVRFAPEIVGAAAGFGLTRAAVGKGLTAISKVTSPKTAFLAQTKLFPTGPKTAVGQTKAEAITKGFLAKGRAKAIIDVDVLQESKDVSFALSGGFVQPQGVAIRTQAALSVTRKIPQELRIPTFTPKGVVGGTTFEFASLSKGDVSGKPFVSLVGSKEVLALPSEQITVFKQTGFIKELGRRAGRVAGISRVDVGKPLVTSGDFGATRGAGFTITKQTAAAIPAPTEAITKSQQAFFVAQTKAISELSGTAGASAFARPISITPTRQASGITRTLTAKAQAPAEVVSGFTRTTPTRFRPQSVIGKAIQTTQVKPPVGLSKIVSRSIIRTQAPTRISKQVTKPIRPGPILEQVTRTVERPRDTTITKIVTPGREKIKERSFIDISRPEPGRGKSIFEITVPPIVPPPTIFGGGFGRDLPSGFGRGRLKEFRTGRRERAFKPSLGGLLTGKIEPSIPTKLTGLELRGVLAKPKKKRKGKRKRKSKTKK